MANEDIFKDLANRPKGSKPMMVLVIIVFMAFIALMMLNPFVKIGAGERGVVMNFGAVQDSVLNEGLHFIIPIMQNALKYKCISSNRNNCITSFNKFS